MVQAVNELRDDITTVVIAHRLRTIASCDIVYVIEKGRIVARGTYDDLITSDGLLRTLANGQSQEVGNT